MKYKYIVNHIQFTARGSHNLLTSYRLGNNCKIDVKSLFKYIENCCPNISFDGTDTELVINIICDKGIHNRVINGKKLNRMFDRICNV